MQRLINGFGWLSAAALLVPLLGFLSAAAIAYQDVMAETRQRIDRTVGMIHEHALRVFEGQEGQLAGVENAIAGLTWDEIASSRKVHEDLRRLDDASDSNLGVEVVRPDGRLAAASNVPSPTPDVDLGHRDYVSAFEHQPPPADLLSVHGSFVGSLMQTVERGVVLFTLARRAPDEAQRTGGVIAVGIRPTVFSDFYRTIIESDRDIVALFRVDGVLLARLPLPDAAVGARVASDSPAFPAIVANPDGRGITQGRMGEIVAYRRITGYPVFISYALSRRVPMAEWRARLIAPGVGATAAAFLLMLLVARAQALARAGLAAETARADAAQRLRGLERAGALGQLAAGVAHDFRNAAQTIASAAHLLDIRAEDPEKVRSYAAAIGAAAMRASALTDRMMAVVQRRDGADAQALCEPKACLAAAAELLGPTLGAGYRLRLAFPPTPRLWTRSDGRELEAAIINLVVNARDAMPTGGEIVLNCGTEATGTEPPADLPPGPYVVVSVRDSGVGMDAETLARAGDAFFTTKPVGQGTGLGLASARGYAETAGGGMSIQSAVGRGTTVALWLPAGPDPSETAASDPA